MQNLTIITGDAGSGKTSTAQSLTSKKITVSTTPNQIIYSIAEISDETEIVFIDDVILPNDLKLINRLLQKEIIYRRPYHEKSTTFKTPDLIICTTSPIHYLEKLPGINITVIKL